MKPKDVLGCAGGALFLLMSSQFIPIFGVVPGLLIPLPFVYTSAKLGRLESAKVTVVSLLIVFLVGRLAGFPRAVYLCIQLGILGVVLAELYRRRVGIGGTVFWGTATLLTVAFLFLSWIGISRGTAPWTLVLDYFRSNLNESVRSYQQIGLSPERVEQIQAYSRRLIWIIERVYPALVVTGSAVVVWLNVLISRRLLRARGLPAPEFGALDRWRAPEALVWGFIGSGFAFLFPWPGVRFVALNVLVVIVVVYCFHGLSILQFYLNKYRFPRLLKIGAYILILMQQVLLIVLALAGLFDQWIDFRKISRNRSVPIDK